MEVKELTNSAIGRFHLVEIPSATFVMGDQTGKGFKQERPAHEVSVDSFYMGKYCVTVREFFDFIIDMGSRYEESWCDYMNPCFIYLDGDTYTKWPGSDNYPMVNVNAEGAIAYCNWLSEKQGLEQVYDPQTLEPDLTKNGFRLPTEAEWEYACGGPEGYIYAYSNAFDPDLINYKHYNGEFRNLRVSATRVGGFGLFDYSLLPVGTLPPNDFGLYEMLGNINEWCNDRYSFYQDVKNNTGGQADSSFQVIRGGCFIDDKEKMRKTFRHAIHYQVKCFIQGFRLAKNTCLDNKK